MLKYDPDTSTSQVQTDTDQQSDCLSRLDEFGPRLTLSLSAWASGALAILAYRSDHAIHAAVWSVVALSAVVLIRITEAASKSEDINR